MYHNELGFPYVVSIGSSFPDAIALNKKGESVSIEFEYAALNFQAHEHDADECDYIVCWEDNRPDAPEEIRSKIISLKKQLHDIFEGGE